MDCKKYWKEREELAKTEIKLAGDIAKLPWHGNHASDNGLFTACNRFIHAQYSTGNNKEAKLALFLMGKYGMGIDEPVTDQILKEYLQN